MANLRLPARLDLDLRDRKIIRVEDPIGHQDAATRAYVYDQIIWYIDGDDDIIAIAGGTIETYTTSETLNEPGGNNRLNIGTNIAANADVGDIIQFPNISSDGYLVTNIEGGAFIDVDRNTPAVPNGSEVVLYKEGTGLIISEAASGFDITAVNGSGASFTIDDAADSVANPLVTEAFYNSRTGIIDHPGGGSQTIHDAFQHSISSGTADRTITGRFNNGDPLPDTYTFHTNIRLEQIIGAPTGRVHVDWIDDTTRNTIFTTSQTAANIDTRGGLYINEAITVSDLTNPPTAGGTSRVVVRETGFVSETLTLYLEARLDDNGGVSITRHTQDYIDGELNDLRTSGSLLTFPNGDTFTGGSDLGDLNSNPLRYATGVARPLGTVVTWENGNSDSFTANIDDIIRSDRTTNPIEITTVASSETGTGTGLFSQVLLSGVPIPTLLDWNTADADTLPGFIMLQELTERGINLILQYVSDVANGALRDATFDVVELIQADTDNATGDVVEGYNVSTGSVRSISNTEIFNIAELTDVRRTLTHIIQNADETIDVTTDITIGRQLAVGSVVSSRTTGDTQFTVLADHGELTSTSNPTAGSIIIGFSTSAPDDIATIQAAFDGAAALGGSLYFTTSDTSIVVSDNVITETTQNRNFYRVLGVVAGFVQFVRAVDTTGTGLEAGDATGVNADYTFFTAVENSPDEIIFIDDVAFRGAVTGPGIGAPDQTYMPASVNAQSGTAVAEAIEDVEDEIDFEVGVLNNRIDSLDGHFDQIQRTFEIANPNGDGFATPGSTSESTTLSWSEIVSDDDDDEINVHLDGGPLVTGLDENHVLIERAGGFTSILDITLSNDTGRLGTYDFLFQLMRTRIVAGSPVTQVVAEETIPVTRDSNVGTVRRHSILTHELNSQTTFDPDAMVTGDEYTTEIASGDVLHWEVTISYDNTDTANFQDGIFADVRDVDWRLVDIAADFVVEGAQGPTGPFNYQIFQADRFPYTTQALPAVPVDDEIAYDFDTGALFLNDANALTGTDGGVWQTDFSVVRNQALATFFPTTVTLSDSSGANPLDTTTNSVVITGGDVLGLINGSQIAIIDSTDSDNIYTIGQRTDVDTYPITPALRFDGRYADGNAIFLLGSDRVYLTTAVVDESQLDNGSRRLDLETWTQPNITGLQGPTGATGPRGDRGISLGRVEPSNATPDAGESVELTFYDDADPENIITSGIVLPAGANGLDGDTGDQGPQGSFVTSIYQGVPPGGAALTDASLPTVANYLITGRRAGDLDFPRQGYAWSGFVINGNFAASSRSAIPVRREATTGINIPSNAVDGTILFGGEYIVDNLYGTTASGINFNQISISNPNLNVNALTDGERVYVLNADASVIDHQDVVDIPNVAGRWYNDFNSAAGAATATGAVWFSQVDINPASFELLATNIDVVDDLTIPLTTGLGVSTGITRAEAITAVENEPTLDLTGALTVETINNFNVENNFPSKFSLFFGTPNGTGTVTFEVDGANATLNPEIYRTNGVDWYWFESIVLTPNQSSMFGVPTDNAGLWSNTLDPSSATIIFNLIG